MVKARKLARSIPEAHPKKLEFDPREIGFTLKVGEKTLAELEEIQADAVKAAQRLRKFAWR